MNLQEILCYTDVEEMELKEQCSKFLREAQANIFKIREWEAMMEEDVFSADQYGILIEYFAISVEQGQNSLASAQGTLKLVDYLERELYEFLSSEKNRGKAEIVLSSVVSAVSSNVADALNVNAFVVTGIASMIILGTLKMGVNAWCKYYEGINKISNEE